MRQGLQIWDERGNVSLDVTSRLTRVEGEINTGTSNGSFVIPLSTGQPFIVVEDDSQIYRRRGPGVWLEGRTIRWEFSSSIYAPTPRVSYKIKYGYF